MAKVINQSSDSQYLIGKLRKLGLTFICQLDDVNKLRDNFTQYVADVISFKKNIITDKIKKSNDREQKIKDSISQDKKRVVGKYVLKLKLKIIINNRTKLENQFEDIPNKNRKTFRKGLRFVENNLNIYYGAIGEEIVSKELVKLPENYFVFNNFYVKLKHPIINKSKNWYLKWFQIDHVVVGPTGIFAIETKNWSKKRLERDDSWGFEQIDMFGEALSILIKKMAGIKQRPKRILVFTNNFESDYYPNVVQLYYKKLNQYITSREIMFSNSLIKKTMKFLIEKNNKKI